MPLESDIDPLSDPIKQILWDRENSLKVDGDGYTLKTEFSPLPTLWGVEGGSDRTSPDYIIEIHRNGALQAIIFETQFNPFGLTTGDRWLYPTHKFYFQSFMKLCEQLTEQQHIMNPYLIRVKWIGAEGGYFIKKEGLRQKEYGPWKLDDLALPDVIHQPGDPWQLLADRFFTYLCNAFGVTG